MKTVPLIVVLALACPSIAAGQAGPFEVQGGVIGAQLPAAPPRDSGRPPATGTARLRGRIVSEAGAPLRRARVASAGGALRRETTTDADGRYEFVELPAGRFAVSAIKPGYIGLPYGQRRPNQPGTLVAVAAGQTVTSIDIALPRGSVITGRVTDEFGEPLTQVQVQAQRFQYAPDGQRRATTNQAAQTDDRGDFRIYGLMPGDYVINAGIRPFISPSAASNPNDVSEGFPTTYYPGTANVEEAQAITLGAGEEASIQVSLIAARLARVNGTVVDSAGSPASGAVLQLMTRQGGGFSSVGAGTVAADGTFEFSGVPPGEHSIEVRPQGHPGVTANAGEFASMPIAVAGGDVTGLSIVMGRGATMSGLVVFEGTASRDRGAQQLRVTASPVEQRPSLIPVAANNGAVDADGSFQLSGMSGRMFLTALAPPPWQLKSITLDGEDITDQPFDVTGRVSVSGLRVTLTDKATTVAGQVMDGSGQPVAESTVVILPADQVKPLTASRLMRVMRATTATFQLSGMRPGRYVAAALDFLEPGRQYAPEFQQRLRKGAREFTVREGETVTVDVPLVAGL